MQIFFLSFRSLIIIIISAIFNVCVGPHYYCLDSFLGVNWEPSETSRVERYVKIVKDIKSSTIFAEDSVLDHWIGFECSSGLFHVFHNLCYFLSN